MKNFSTPEAHRGLNEQDKRIIAASINPHFIDLPAKVQESELRAAIIFVVVMLGIKTDPDKETVNFILAFMRNHFKHFTLQEFKLAFELNILSDDEKKPQHFHSFNLEFITPVLKNYLLLKQSALANLNLITAPKQLHEHKSTDEDYYLRLKEYLHKNKSLPVYWNWLAVYNFMEDSGMVTETDEWIKEFKSKVKERIKLDATMQKLKAKDAVERMRIDELMNPKKMNEIYKIEYVKMKVK